MSYLILISYYIIKLGYTNGIQYTILNIINNKCYIGSSKNLSVRSKSVSKIRISKALS